METPLTELFTKRLDKRTGQYFHVIRSTEERVWDEPHLSKIALDPPSLESQSKFLQGKKELTLQSREHQRERLELIQLRRTKYQEEKKKEDEVFDAEEKKRLDNVWLSACERGKYDGIVHLNWEKLGYISERIEKFEGDYNHPLITLSLHGNELTTLDGLPRRCPRLKELSLASNLFSHIDDSIGEMKSLTHINLVRNRLVTLPETIGDCSNLQVLNLSNNCIQYLPRSIGKLRCIRTFNLECNQLEQLPEDIGEMMCEELKLDFNKLATLPRSIGYMSSLSIILANNNCIRFLPVDLCSSTSLRVIHLSKNEIMEIPESIGKMVQLESLWLDFNKLSALPPGFHNLINLKELKMEGNNGMIYPPLSLLSKGVPDILNWCQLKLASSAHVKYRNIVLSVQSLLEQVGTYKLGGSRHGQLHESVYEANISCNQDKHYQFLFPVFWSDFLPKMEEIWSKKADLRAVVKSFPYERHEVEQALSEYTDAGGKVMNFTKDAKFRRCCCLNDKGERKVCIPPKMGWMCKRSAVLVRMNIILESGMVERRRMQNEKNRIHEAEEAAEKVVKEFFTTEEGMLHVRNLAEEKISKRHDDTTKNLTKNKSIRRMRTCFKGKSDVSAELKVSEAKIRKQIVEQEIEKRRSSAIDINSKMRLVLDSWFGHTTEEIFSHWRRVMTQNKKQREMDEGEHTAQIKRVKQEEIEKLELAAKELGFWKEHWDDFYDKPFWVHSDTGEKVFNKPSVMSIVQSSWIPHERVSSTKENSSHKENSQNSKIQAKGNMLKVEIEAITAATRILERRRNGLLGVHYK